MNPDTLSVSDYLTVHLQQIVAYGPGHFLHWARPDAPEHWLQISVHGGICCHLTAQFVLPQSESKRLSGKRVPFGKRASDRDKRTLDRVFRQIGGVQAQERGDSLVVYHLARSAAPAELYAALTTVGVQCAEALRLLWDVRRVEQIALLAARGPHIALSRPQGTPLRLRAA